MDDRPYACRRCGKRFAKRRSLSEAGYCSAECGADAQAEYNLSVARREGPGWEQWRQAVLRAAGEGGGGVPAGQSESS